MHIASLARGSEKIDRPAQSRLPCDTRTNEEYGWIYSNFGANLFSIIL